jgi:hypothetical protein
MGHCAPGIAGSLGELDETPINETMANDLAGGVFLRQQRNALLAGGSGTGKTHLVFAIARSCIHYGARFYNGIDRVARFDFVFLDERGYLPFARQSCRSTRLPPGRRVACLLELLDELGLDCLQMNSSGGPAASAVRQDG